MLPTIFLGYLAIRTAETEKLVVWERLKESYTSLANVVSDQLDDMLSSAESDFRDSVFALPAHDQDSLRRLSHQLEDEHGVMGQIFFLNASGGMIFPENPRRRRRDVGTRREGEKDIFESYLAAGERQEFKHNSPQRAIYEYQRIFNDLTEPAYKAIALNGIARCYAKLELNQEAVNSYSEIVSKYINATDGRVNIAPVAYLQAASIYKKMGDADAAAGTLMAFYSDLSQSKWDLDADEISYFVDRARRRLLTYGDSPDADEFAKIDEEADRLVRLQRFLKDYERLVSHEMMQIAGSAADGSESMPHLLRYTSTSPYLVSYLPLNELDDIALAGFEVNLGYLASQGFKELLSKLNAGDDIILAILNADNEIVETTQKIQQPEKPIAVVASSSLPFWRIGVYLKEPRSLENMSKRKAGLRIFLIAGLVLAIAFGIYLALREAKREAELAQLRSDFVANVSHELRTPLSSIQIFSETLKQGKAGSKDKQEQYLDTITSESDRLARLVDNVLDFSRLEKHSKDFDFKPVDVTELVSSTVEACRFYAEQRGATINLNMAENLPKIMADSEALSQMLMNLVDNAVKYSEDESEITINVFRRGNNIVIQAADKGIGMEGDDVKKIFDKFYRGKNAASLGTGGTGLGLTMAKAVAEAHGGDILVRSKEGEGSRFSVILPLPEEVSI